MVKRAWRTMRENLRPAAARAYDWSMTPTEAFVRARDALLAHRDDLDAARAVFRWPELGEVRHMITDAAGASKLRGPERLRVRLAVGGAAGFTAYDDALNAPATFPAVTTRAEDPLLLYFTSGTTAKPKLVLHTHQSYPVGHLSTMYWLGLREGDVHQNISSPGWAKHAWSSFFAPWNAGATILVHEAPRFVASRTLDVLREHRVTTMCAPPTVWRMLILEALGDKPEELRELASAGEPLNPEVIETVQKAWGIAI